MSQDKPDEKSAGGSGLTFPQIAAGALAAATAAILGSFMGVLGTIGGAAAASIVSTVGSSLYQRSLERTRDKVKERLVVAGGANTKVGTAVARITGQPAPPSSPGATQVQRAPGPRPGVPAAGGRPQQPVPARPYGRPGVPPPVPPRPGPQGPGGDQALRAGGRTVTTRVDPASPPRPTGGIPAARTPGTPPGGMRPGGPTAPFRPGPGSPGGPPPTAYLGAPGPGGPDGSDAATQLTSFSSAADGDAPARGPIRWKRWVALGGLAASVFAIGILASLFTETAVGHPLSGGSSGTSVGSIFGQDTGSATPTTTTAPSDEETSGSGTTTSSPSESGSSSSSDSGQSGQRQQSDQNGSGSSGGQTTSRAPTTSQNSGGSGGLNRLGDPLDPNG